METKEKYTLKEALQIIAKHMRDLADIEKNAKILPFKPKEEMGKTSSGKTVYLKDHPSHADFSSHDHKEAAKMHQDAMKKIRGSKEMAGGFKSGGEVKPEHREAYEHHAKQLAHHADMGKKR